jgi:hypothetical protein
MGFFVTFFAVFKSGITMLTRLFGMILGFVVVSRFMMGWLRRDDFWQPRDAAPQRPYDALRQNVLPA